MQGPISRLAASMAEAREERRDSSNASVPELDDLDGRSIPSLLRLRAWRIVRLVLCAAAIPVGWIAAPHLTGLLPVLALALTMGGALGVLMTTYLVVHVQKALKAGRYEASFGPH